MKKLLFNPLNLLGTLFVFGFIGAFSASNLKLDFIDMVGEALEDFELADVYYRMRDDKDVPFDDRVVLVNIGDLPRSDIARQIMILNKYEPAVIAVDALFYSPKPEDTFKGIPADTLLAMAIAGTKNFVISCEAEGYHQDSNYWEKLHEPLPVFSQYAHKAFVNTLTNEDGDALYNTWKQIKPRFYFQNGDTLDSFSAKAVQLYDPAAYKAFMSRGNDIEDIYFKGNIASSTDTTFSAKYTLLDWNDVFEQNFLPEAIKGKIILMGYMGRYYNSKSWDEDKFYTPLNPRQIGRTYPDMYGVVIHANVISMILDRNYIDRMPDWLSNTLGVLMCYLMVSVFIFILRKERLAPWYGALSKTIQLLLVISLTFITVELFVEYHYKADLSLAMVCVALSGDLSEIMMDFIVNVFEKPKPEGHIPWWKRLWKKKETEKPVHDSATPAPSDTSVSAEDSPSA